MRSWLRSKQQQYQLLSVASRSPANASGCGDTCAYSSTSPAAGVGELSRHYALNHSQIPASLRQYVSPLSLDAETREFLDSCKPSFWQDWLAKILRIFFSLTDTNGILGRGHMFVLSRAHAAELLGSSLQGSTGQGTLLDVGAGDGEVTAKLAPLFDRVHCTEVSNPMARRLRSKGYTVTVTPYISPSNGFPTDAVYDVVSLLNLVDRCDHPKEMLRDAARLVKPVTGRMLLAVVLPFSEFVEEGTVRRAPRGALPMRGARCGDGVTLEQSLSALLERVIVPLGLEVERIARVPYLCRGDARRPYYVLSDAILVLKHGNGSGDGYGSSSAVTHGSASALAGGKGKGFSGSQPVFFPGLDFDGASGSNSAGHAGVSSLGALSVPASTTILIDAAGRERGSGAAAAAAAAAGGGGAGGGGSRSTAAIEFRYDEKTGMVTADRRAASPAAAAAAAEKGAGLVDAPEAISHASAGSVAGAGRGGGAGGSSAVYEVDMQGGVAPMLQGQRAQKRD